MGNVSNKIATNCKKCCYCLEGLSKNPRQIELGERERMDTVAEIGNPFIGTNVELKENVMLDPKILKNNYANIPNNEENLNSALNEKENDKKNLILKEKDKENDYNLLYLTSIFDPALLKLKIISKNNNHNYEGFDLVYEEKSAPHDLKIYMKSYLTEKKHRVNIIRNEWYAPCTSEKFVKIMGNLELQKKLDTSLEVYNLLERDENNQLYLYYLGYKKILFTSARDFVYVKAVQDLSRNKTEFCEAAFSIDFVKHPPLEDKVRGIFICSGQVSKNLNQEEIGETKYKNIENVCRINLYSECDFKLNIPLLISKPTIISELKKYIEKLIKIGLEYEY